MRQLIIGIVLGAVLMGSLVWAQQSQWNPYSQRYEPVPMPDVREQMLQYNLNQWLQQQRQDRMFPPIPHPC